MPWVRRHRAVITAAPGEPRLDEIQGLRMGEKRNFGIVITARIGIQGRVIAGPAGAPATVEIPMRVAVVQGGVNEKVIATKAYRTTVQMTEDGSVPFTLVADDLVYPTPSVATADSYIF